MAVATPVMAPPLDRTAAAGDGPVVRQRLGKAHADAGAERRRQADEEGILRLTGQAGGRENRRQGRDRAVHQAEQRRLDLLQHKTAIGSSWHGDILTPKPGNAKSETRSGQESASAHGTSAIARMARGWPSRACAQADMMCPAGSVRS